MALAGILPTDTVWMTMQEIADMYNVFGCYVHKAVKARIAQYDKETVFTVLKKVAASPFLLGCNDRNWKCDFDWIFKAGNFTKILEGNYDEKRNNNTAGGRKESVSRLKGLAEAILTDSET